MFKARNTSLKLITFDVFGTLLKPKKEIGTLYYEAVELLVPNLPKEFLSSKALSSSFKSSYIKWNEEFPVYGYHHNMTIKDWWRGVVLSTIQNASQEHSDKCQPNLNSTLPRNDIFEMLWNDFSCSKNYELYSDTRESLSRLYTLSQKYHFQLGILSNMDDRILELLKDFSIDHYFHHQSLASKVGAMKPNSLLFQDMIDRCGLKDGSESIHVGDQFKEDIQGCLNAGWSRGYWLTRQETRPQNGLGWESIQSLLEIPDRLESRYFQSI